MKKSIKKLFTMVCALTVGATCVLSSVACGTRVVDDIQEGKTNITVGIYEGGTGTEWIYGAVERFEEKYANVSFEEGKTGVHVIVDENKSYNGNDLATTVKNNDSINVYIAAEVPYTQLKLDNALYDITDLVTETVNDQDGKTIESKLDDEYKEFLGQGGTYYAIPMYEWYTGLTYDAGVFKSKKLYFSDKLDQSSSNNYPGTNAFVTSNSDTLSCGPDGVFGTYDDGLPSTYQEFYKLMEKMINNNVTPFVFTYSNLHYTNMLIKSLFQNYIGADGVNAHRNFNTNGTEIEIITGFNGEEPIVEKMALTKANANNISQSLGLYYASEFANKVFSDRRYYDTKNTATSNIGAMERFLKSGLDGGDYIGMIIEGSYWYNEATESNLFIGLKENYSETYQKKDFKFMPLPHQYAGTVTPRDAEYAMTPVLVNTEAYAFINANTPNNLIKASKAFLSFCYGDEELCTATKMSNGVVRGVNYDFSSITSEINSYAKSVLDMRSQAKTGNSFVRMVSTDSLFLSNLRLYSLSTISDFWTSGLYANVYSAFHDGNLTTKQYFEGLYDSDWNK